MEDIYYILIYEDIAQLFAILKNYFQFLIIGYYNFAHLTNSNKQLLLLIIKTKQKPIFFS